MQVAAAKIVRPPLRYHGGKWRLAPWLIEHFPRHRTYVEPYGGGGSVLCRKDRSYSEVYNDRWGRVVDVFRVLRNADQAADLRRRIELTPFARDEFEAITDEALSEIDDIVERVRLTIYRSFAGFGSAATNGAHSTGFRANSNRSHTTPAHDWVNYPNAIPAFVERWRGVVIENRDALDVMHQHDGAATLHYVDPPYPHSTRNMRRGNACYSHEMTDDDHRAMAASLRELTGMVVLSGYPCPLYDAELFADWHRVERPALADGGRDRIEVIWINDSAWAALERERVPLFAGLQG